MTEIHKVNFWHFTDLSNVNTSCDDQSFSGNSNLSGSLAASFGIYNTPRQFA